MNRRQDIKPYTTCGGNIKMTTSFDNMKIEAFEILRVSSYYIKPLQLYLYFFFISLGELTLEKE